MRADTCTGFICSSMSINTFVRLPACLLCLSRLGEQEDGLSTDSPVSCLVLPTSVLNLLLTGRQDLDLRIPSPLNVDQMLWNEVYNASGFCSMQEEILANMCAPRPATHTEPSCGVEPPC